MTTPEAVIEVRSGWKRAVAGRKRGQSLVEFTLAMPLLLITMTGMLSFGFIMHNFVVLTNAVGSTVTLLSMSRGQTTDPCALAYTAMQSAAPSLTAASFGFTFVINGSTYTTTTCTAAAAGMVQGASAQMKVTYPCTLAVYGMSAPSCSLAAQTAEMIQ